MSLGFGSSVEMRTISAANWLGSSGSFLLERRMPHSVNHKREMKNILRKELAGATRASVKKEMAKARMATSARESKMRLVAARIAQGKL